MDPGFTPSCLRVAGIGLMLKFVLRTRLATTLVEDTHRFMRKRCSTGAHLVQAGLTRWNVRRGLETRMMETLNVFHHARK